MTDKAIFLGMSGAKSALAKLAIMTNNLANVNTTGFRADYESVKQHPVGSGETRVFSTISDSYTNFHPGPVINTGRDLDLAISGKGFFAVQGQNGQEAYTRAGDLQVVNGNLVTRTGSVVLGNGGVINIPAAERLVIGDDGTVSVLLAGQHEMELIDRVKLVNPDTAKLTKGTDGLFYLTGGQNLKPDESIKLVHGAIESSNVNAIETLVNLVDLSRSFEVHTNLMKTMQENAGKSNQILALQE